MATLYFRNVNGSWGTAANWSLSNGGPADAAAPTNADDVFFTSLSGNCTGIPGASICKSMDCTGYSGTMTWTTGYIQLYGNVTLSPTMTLVRGTGSAAFYIYANCLFTSAGKYIPNAVLVNGLYTITIVDSLNCESVRLSSSTIWAGVGFTTETLSLEASLLQTFKSGSTYRIGNIINNYSAGSSHMVIKSDTAGTRVNFIVTGICDLGYTDFTDINASDGRTIYTFGGIVNNCVNINTMTDYIAPVNKTTSSILSI